MSFSDLFGKSTTADVYKAVVLWTGDSGASSNDLKESLLPPSSSSGRCGDNSTLKTTWFAFLFLVSGFYFGVVAALFGLSLAVSSSPTAVLLSLQEKANLGVMCSALAWSSANVVTADAVFHTILRSFGDDSNEEDGDPQQECEMLVEHHLAMGIFAGFFALCNVFDTNPFASLLLTAGIAAFWGLLMTITGGKSFVTATIKVHPKGAEFPLPDFVV